MKIDTGLSVADVAKLADGFFEVAAPKVADRIGRWNPVDGAPVITRAGKYTSQAWTEWTEGFHAGCASLIYEATGDRSFLDTGIRLTDELIPKHVSHTGVHDHGFNVVSTYGALRRLALAGQLPEDSEAILKRSELALKISGAVQAARWTLISDRHNAGFIYSFNGPHSLFVDTMRSLRSLFIAHSLGHVLLGEGDQCISLLDRAINHADATSKYTVYSGEGRDSYDVPGRVAHEAIFNTNNGKFRSPNSQQGFSPFTTWTRGAAWVILGFAEVLEGLDRMVETGLAEVKDEVISEFAGTAIAASDHYIDSYSTLDGIPPWDDGAPRLHEMAGYQERVSDPWNSPEPLDSSAAAITAQGFLRLGRWHGNAGKQEMAERYTQAGLTIAKTLFADPYVSTEPGHEGLLLHSVYHRPNGWDYIPDGRQSPCGESSMWGDFHALELALLIKRMAASGFLEWM